MNLNDSHKVDTWLAEKSEACVDALVRISETLLHYENELPEHILEALKGQLESGLSRALLVLAGTYYSEQLYDQADARLIMQLGSNGKRAVVSKYKRQGHLFITDVGDFTSQLMLLLEGGRENRQGINELLRLCILQDPLLNKLKQETENLNMGYVSWPEYVVKAKSIIASNA